jgi:integrase/recombinase XerC
MRSPRHSVRLPRPIAVDNIKRTFDVCECLDDDSWINTRNVALYMLLYGGGLRTSEALSLRFSDVPLSESVHIVGKGNKDRLVPVLKIVREAVDCYVKACPYSFQPNSPLFLGKRGKALNSRVVRKSLEDIRNMLGFVDLGCILRNKLDASSVLTLI